MKAVILAPHQDDELIGAGLAIINWLEQGYDVHVAWITDGSQAYNFTRIEGTLTEEPGKTDISESELAAIRKAEAKKAMGVVGVPEENLHFFDLPDQAGDANVEPGIEKLKPILEGANILVMPANGENHVDHAAAYQIGVRACQELNLIDIEIYLYKMFGAYGAPFKNVADRKLKWKMIEQREKIKEALECYDSQRNLQTTWLMYDLVLSGGMQYLVKVKLEEYGQLDYF
jgi:LmbE family N-acetylglucosaminyl deacetylase